MSLHSNVSATFSFATTSFMTVSTRNPSKRFVLAFVRASRNFCSSFKHATHVTVQRTRPGRRHAHAMVPLLVFDDSKLLRSTLATHSWTIVCLATSVATTEGTSIQLSTREHLNRYRT